MSHFLNNPSGLLFCPSSLLSGPSGLSFGPFDQSAGNLDISPSLRCCSTSEVLWMWSLAQEIISIVDWFYAFLCL